MDTFLGVDFIICEEVFNEKKSREYARKCKKEAVKLITEQGADYRGGPESRGEWRQVGALEA